MLFRSDVVDSCTLQPETINGNKDDDGCPDRGDPALLLSADRIELLAPIGFQGSAVKPASRIVLDQIAATLRAHPEIRKLVIHVHVRGRGDPDGEEKLSRRRGEAILAYLERKGVEAGRLVARAWGSRKPLGRAALDERVELTLE